MSRMLRNWFCVMSLTLHAVVSAAPRGAYLATVGPAPLRFQAVPAEELVTVELPARAMNEAELALLAAAKDKTVVGVDDPSPQPTPQDLNPKAGPEIAEMPESPLREPAQPTEPASPEPSQQVVTNGNSTLTPQMFVQFFRNSSPASGTTNAAPSIVLPVNFLPPPPAPLPSSRATYEKSP